MLLNTFYFFHVAQGPIVNFGTLKFIGYLASTIRSSPSSSSDLEESVPQDTSQPVSPTALEDKVLPLFPCQGDSTEKFQVADEGNGMKRHVLYMVRG